MYELLKNLDRRWIFLMMLLAVLIPLLLQWTFPEKISPLTRNTFAEIERLKPGDKVLLSFDYDPSSEGELSPMATSFVYHAAKRGAKGGRYILGHHNIYMLELLQKLQDLSGVKAPKTALPLPLAKLGNAVADLGELKKLFATDGADTESSGFMRRFKELADDALGSEGTFESRNASLKEILRRNTRNQDSMQVRLDQTEALRTESRHFLQCIDQNLTPETDGPSGLEVVRVLEAASLSMRQRTPVKLARSSGA